MIGRAFFVAILFLTACGQIKSTPENNTVGTIQDSVRDTITANDLKSLRDNSRNNAVNANSGLNCERLLHSLVNSSTFNPEVKKFKFKVGVDELSGGIATLKVSMRNAERNEDMAIGWLKMDFNKNKLLDVTSDPDQPEELKYDTMLFKKVIKHCDFNQ
jgi:hypothetical protein